jgi:uncharacterized protein (DUF58 family)
MTGFWSSLTPRGRGFMTAGIAALLCGVVLGERDLVMIGVVLVVLPVIVAMWLTGSGDELHVHRSLSRQQVGTDQPVDVELRITGVNSGSRRTLVREMVPYALGTSPRFTIGSIRGREAAVASYTVRSQLRGRYTVGPTTVTTTDPFGLLSRHTELGGTGRIVVTPRPEPLDGRQVSAGDGHNAGDFHPRSFIGGAATDVTVRDYRRGDDLRRVHWPSTAHAGSLMVRREERPRQTACTVLIDNRLDAHRGSGSRSSLEQAVRAAASVAIHLIGLGCRVHAYDATGLALLDEEPQDTAAEAILTALALLPGTTRSGLADDWSRYADGSFVVAVLGALGEHDLGLLARVGRNATDRLALAIDADRWATPVPPGGPGDPSDPANLQPSADPAGRLGASGWRAVMMTPHTRIADAWQALSS